MISISHLGNWGKKGRKEDFSIAVDSAVEIIAARTPENGYFGRKWLKLEDLGRRRETFGPK